MPANRKGRNASQVSELDKQRRKVARLEERAERLSEKRTSYQPKEPPLKYPAWRYEHRRLETGSIDLEDMRKEYSKLRSIANKRIERVGKSEFAQVSETYKRHSDGFAKLSELTNSELVDQLSEVVKFLNSKRSSLEYLKRERAALLSQFEVENERRALVNLIGGEDLFDYLPVSEADQRDYWEFLNFLNAVSRSTQSRAWYETQKEMWDTIRQKHFSWKDILADQGLNATSDVNTITKAFNFWSNHKQELESIKDVEARKKELGIKDITDSKNTAAALRKFLIKQDQIAKQKRRGR